MTTVYNDDACIRSLGNGNGGSSEPPVVRTYTTTHQLVIEDLAVSGNVVEMSSSDAVDVIVPLDSTLLFTPANQAMFVAMGLGNVNFKGETDSVIIHSKDDFRTLNGQYAGARLYKRNEANEWMLVGDLKVTGLPISCVGATSSIYFPSLTIEGSVAWIVEVDGVATPVTGTLDDLTTFLNTQGLVAVISSIDPNDFKVTSAPATAINHRLKITEIGQELVFASDDVNPTFMPITNGFTCCLAPVAPYGTSVKWSPDGQYLAVGTVIRGLNLFNFDGNNLDYVPTAIGLSTGITVYEIKFSTDSELMLLAGSNSSTGTNPTDTTIIGLRKVSGAYIEQVNFDSTLQGKLITAFDISVDKQYVIVYVSESTNMRIYKLGISGIYEFFADVPDSVSSLGNIGNMSFSPDGTKLIVRTLAQQLPNQSKLTLFSYADGVLTLLSDVTLNVALPDWQAVQWIGNTQIIAAGHDGDSLANLVSVRIISDVLEATVLATSASENWVVTSNNDGTLLILVNVDAPPTGNVSIYDYTPSTQILGTRYATTDLVVPTYIALGLGAMSSVNVLDNKTFAVCDLGSRGVSTYQINPDKTISFLV